MKIIIVTRFFEERKIEDVIENVTSPREIYYNNFIVNEDLFEHAKNSTLGIDIVRGSWIF